MKKYKTLQQITNFLRSQPEGYQFSTKSISETLRLPEKRVRHYVCVLKEAGYILKVHSDKYYRVYIATPKFLNRNIRTKTILKRHKIITQLRNQENKPSADIYKNIQEQTKEIRELKYAFAQLKHEITKRRETNFNRSVQGTLFNGGQ